MTPTRSDCTSCGGAIDPESGISLYDFDVMAAREAAEARVYAPDVAEHIKEVAHEAYHQHAEECACRTVGHLTAFIALEVRSAIAALMTVDPEKANPS